MRSTMAIPGAPLIFRLMTRTIAAAHQAGRVIRDVLSSGHLNIVTKEGDRNNLQTAADLAAQNCIVAALSREFPGINIIAEEDEVQEANKTIGSGSLVAEIDLTTFDSLSCPENLKDVTSGQIVVWVDPLDGTSEFTQGLLEQVTVLIGVAVDGKPLAGVVHQPFWGQGEESTEKGIGRSIWAIQGCGMGQHFGHVLAPDAPLKLSESPFSATPPPPNKIIVVTSRSRRSPLIESAVKALNPDEVICAGGCGNKILMLLEGRASHYVYASPGTKKWDTCAPDALLSEAGGVLTDVFGKPLDYGPTADHVNRQGILASTDSEKHGWALSVLPPELKEHL